MKAKIPGKTSFAANFSGYDEYIPIVDKPVDAAWKKQPSIERPCSSKGQQIQTKH